MRLAGGVWFCLLLPVPFVCDALTRVNLIEGMKGSYEGVMKGKRGVNRIFLMLTLLYALLCAGGCAFQRRLIYFPTKLDPSYAEKAAEREGFLAWRNKSGEIIG